MSASYHPRAGARIRGAVLGVAVLVLLALAAAAFFTWFWLCPCERTPGAYLRGELVEEPVVDWRFANDVPLCQIQVPTRPLPHAINLNCMATEQGDLYLSCAQCEGKRWSTAALADPRARLRLGDAVYPVLLSHVTDAEEIDGAWQARTAKLHALRVGDGSPPPQNPRPDDAAWWTFRVLSAGE